MAEAILELRVQNRLELSEVQLEPARKILADYGNMSSATVLFVLKEIMENPAAKAGERVCAMAFGPGTHGGNGAVHPALGRLMFELARAEDAVEEMDRPDCDPKLLLRRTYAQFPLVNRAVAGWGRLYAELIVDQVGHEPARHLVGYRLRWWGYHYHAGQTSVSRRNQPQSFGEIDPLMNEPLTMRAVPDKNRDYPQAVSNSARATAAQLVARRPRFDVVSISNHLLHHLDGQQFSGLLADSQRLATGRVVHADIRRSRIAAVLFGAATLPLATSSFIRRDGLLSIRRSFTPVELARRVPAGWR